MRRCRRSGAISNASPKILIEGRMAFSKSKNSRLAGQPPRVQGADPRVGSGRSTDGGTDRLHTSGAGRRGKNISGCTSWRSQLSGTTSSVGDSRSFPKSAPSARCCSRHRSMIRVGSCPSNLASTNFERIASGELFKRGKKLPGVTSPICRQGMPQVSVRTFNKRACATIE